MGINGGVTARYISEKYFSMICGAQIELNFSQHGWDEYYEDYPTLSYTRTMNYDTKLRNGIRIRKENETDVKPEITLIMEIVNIEALKILYVITGLGMGGAETITIDVAQKMLERGHEVAVLYLSLIHILMYFWLIIVDSIPVCWLLKKSLPRMVV